MKKQILTLILLSAGITQNAHAATLKENVHSAGSSLVSGVKKVGTALFTGLKKVGTATASGVKTVYKKITTKKKPLSHYEKGYTVESDMVSPENKTSADIHDNLR